MATLIINKIYGKSPCRSLLFLFCCFVASASNAQGQGEKQRTSKMLPMAVSVEYGTREPLALRTNVYLFLLERKLDKFGAFFEAGVVMRDIPELWYQTLGLNVSYGKFTVYI